jgi:hypothetical protein
MRLVVTLVVGWEWLGRVVVVADSVDIVMDGDIQIGLSYKTTC